MAEPQTPQKAQIPQMPTRSGSRYDAIVIGGGVNGLTCAAQLAKSGVRTVLLEQRGTVGGCAAESELAPGFTVRTLRVPFVAMWSRSCSSPSTG